MTNDAGHLNSATAELFALSSTERIRAIETDRWVQYPRARQALAILSYVLRHPRKTMIMEKFRLDHPADFDPETGKARTPVLALQMSGKPNERRLYAQLLTALGAPHNPRATIVAINPSSASKAVSRPLEKWKPWLNSRDGAH